MIIRSFYCLCFTVTLGVSALAQNGDIDSLLNLSRQAHKNGNLYDEVNHLLDAAFFLNRRQHYDQSLKITREALIKTNNTLKTDLKNKKLIMLKAKILYQLGHTYYYLSSYDSSQWYYNESLSNSAIVHDTIAIGKTYNALSTIASKRYQGEESLSLLMKSAQMLEGKGDIELLSVVYNNIGVELIRNLKQSEKAREYYKKSNSIATDERSIAMGYSNIGNTFDSYTEMDSAQWYYKQAIKLQRKIGDYHHLTESLNNISTLYALNNLPEKSTPFLLEAEGINKKTGNKLNQCYTYYNLSNNAYRLKDYKLAMKYAEESLALAKELTLSNDIRDSYKQISETYEHLGEIDQAYKYLLLFQSLNDSLLNIENKERIASLELKYETKQKEQQIESLKQEASIQLLEIKQKNMWLIGSALASVLLLIAGSTYIGQRRLRFKQQTLALEQKLLRTQMNPHFLFNSLMCIQHFIYQNNPGEAGKYLSKYARLMRLILENSRLDFVPIHKEIEALQYYFELQQLRFKNKFEYHISVDPEITEDILIPPMFAQPFIENSLEHGILQKSEKGKVDVKFEMSQNRIHFSVTDNGVGIKTLESDKPEDHQSLATKITRERLDNLYKGKSGLAAMKISELRDENNFITGTQASFYIPYSLA